MKMFKRIVFNGSGVLFLLFAFVFSGVGFAMGQPVTVVVDGRILALDQPATMDGERVLVPLRGVFESLGAQVTYDASRRSINAVRGGTQIQLTVGSRQAYVNGEARSLDAPPVAMGGRVMVPLRFVSEALGAEVKWQAYNRTVSILNNNPAPVSVGAPRIDSITHNALGTLMPGDTLTVTLRGESGGVATFDITNVAMGVAMQETSFGLYQGSYTVDQARQIPFASVAGHLRLNGRESTLVAIKPVAIGGGNTTSNSTLIQSVTASPRTANVGQTVTATVQGAPSATAIMAVGNGQKILMSEGPSGTYTGTYTAPMSLQGRYADLMVKLQTSDGRAQTITDAGAIYVNGATGSTFPLSVGGPSGGSQVPQTFDVAGTTQPNAMVRVRLLAANGILGNILGIQQEVVNTQVRSDSNGIFVAHVDAGNSSSGSKLTVLVQAQNDQGSQSPEKRIDLTRQ